MNTRLVLLMACLILLLAWACGPVSEAVECERPTAPDGLNWQSELTVEKGESFYIRYITAAGQDCDQLCWVSDDYVRCDWTTSILSETEGTVSDHGTDLFTISQNTDGTYTLTTFQDVSLALQ